jgi:RNA polymerase sigma-70 factor (ECF subfamily)
VYANYFFYVHLEGLDKTLTLKYSFSTTSYFYDGINNTIDPLKLPKKLYLSCIEVLVKIILRHLKTDDNIIFYISSFCNGNNEAIAAQYKLWLPQLYLIAYRYLQNQEKAEDVIADCFEKLLSMPLEKRKQKFIDEQINLKALLIVMVKNRCLDTLKLSQNRNRILYNLSDSFSKVSQNNVQDDFTKDNVKLLLACLPEKEQTIMKLYLEGYKHKEISEKLQLSEKSISNLLSLSRKKIKNIWRIFME